jgi:membrane protease YdiL (CAAX protease family)
VLAYYALTFAISWGGFVLVVGPGGFPGNGSQFDALTPFVVLAMLAGPSIAGMLMTGVVDGRAGYRGVLARLLRWRVGARWYAVALLPAPLLAAAVLSALSIRSPIFTTEAKAALVLSSVVAGLIGGFFEELGWTGFAVPRLRLRHGVFTTGLLVGVPWGAWHLLQGLWVGGTYAGAIPLALSLLLGFFSGIAELTAYRVLMVWVYDRTESLLLAALMHASLIAGTIFLFTPLAAGVPMVTYSWVFDAALWVVVAAVAVANGGQFTRQPRRRTARR